jgi:hypothetical protein
MRVLIRGSALRRNTKSGERVILAFSNLAFMRRGRDLNGWLMLCGLRAGKLGHFYYVESRAVLVHIVECGQHHTYCRVCGQHGPTRYCMACILEPSVRIDCAGGWGLRRVMGCNTKGQKI